MVADSLSERIYFSFVNLSFCPLDIPKLGPPIFLRVIRLSERYPPHTRKQKKVQKRFVCYQ